MTLKANTGVTKLDECRARLPAGLMKVSIHYEPRGLRTRGKPGVETLECRQMTLRRIHTPMVIPGVLGAKYSESNVRTGVERRGVSITIRFMCMQEKILAVRKT